MAQKLSGGKNVVNDRDKDVINDNIPASATDQLTHNHEGKNTDRVVLVVLLYCLLTIVLLLVLWFQTRVLTVWFNNDSYYYQRPINYIRVSLLLPWQYHWQRSKVGLHTQSIKP